MIALNEIKNLRKQLNLTQSDLAKLSGVSQSLIAKIESGIIDPAYSNAVAITSTLEQLSQKKELQAKDVMTKKVTYINSNDSLKLAVKKMREHNFSQLPVFQDKVPIGLITEKDIMNIFLSDKPHNISVREFMEDCPPIVNPHTQISILSGLLKYTNMVLVKDKEKIIGLITRSDLLKTF